MNLVTDKRPLGMNRRKFLKGIAAGTITATVLMVYRPPSKAEDEEEDLVALVRNGGKKPVKHDYAYAINVNLCIGAGKCVEACSTENNVPAGLFRTWVERYVETEEGIYVDSPNGSKDGFVELEDTLVEDAKRAWFAPKLCNHCRNPPCVQVCPVGATFATTEGFVLVDAKHCIGCAACVHGCPYGSRFMNPDTGVADKCTWCYHRVKKGQQPACVEACPTGARMFGDLNDPDSAVSKIFAKGDWMVLKPEMHTDSYCFYVEMPRETI